MQTEITRKEWLWVVVMTLVILAVLSSPYLIGGMHSTKDMRFGGFLFGIEDANSYIAKMRFGAQDGWLYRLQYTSEPHEGGFVYPFYLGLGKLAALISAGGKQVATQALVAVYHSARVVLGLVLLLITYRFTAEFLEPAPQRRLAWILASVGGGLGWLGLFIQGSMGQPMEFYIPEAFGVLLPYGLPHLALARCMLLVGWMLLIRAVVQKRLVKAVYASVAWLIMSIIVPFHAALIGVLMVAWLAGLWLVRRQFPRWAFQMCALAGSLPLIALLYNGWLFTANPVFAAWSQQNQLGSPSMLDFLLAYGADVAPGIVSVRQWRFRELDENAVLLLTWPPTALVLANLPVNVQRRLLEAVVVPLSILAVQGIWRIVGERPEERNSCVAWRLRQVATGIVLVLLFPSTVLLIGGGIVTANQAQWPVFHSSAEVAALGWLGTHAPFDSVVLSSRHAGNVLPAHAPVRVYVGHGPETIDSDRKAAVMEAFFSSAMSDSERLALIEDVQAKYIWVTPDDFGDSCNQSGCLDENALPVILRYQNEGYMIYEVEIP